MSLNSRFVSSRVRLAATVGASVLAVAGAGLMPVAAAAAPQAESQWVVDYSGRPPFKRSLEPVEQNAAAPAPRAELAEADNSRRVGPAGKRPLSTFSQPAETVEFARFEERAGGEGIQPRTLRGAPGKSWRRN